MRVLLETERLVLRGFSETDVDHLVDLDSDPQVVHFITGGRPTPRAEIEEDVLPAFVRHDPATPDQGFWAAEDRGTGDFLGWFHLRPGEGHGPDEPELGYRLRRSVWGRGMATEGSSALVDKAFEDPRVRRVLAETMVVHRASRRVMEKCGMSVVRHFHADWPDRIPGDELGDVQYAIDRATWERLRARR